MINQKVVDTIVKILEKTTGNGCTQAEADAAVAMASRIMERHNLTMDSVIARKKGRSPSKVDINVGFGSTRMKGNRATLWQQQLANAVAIITGTRGVVRRMGRGRSRLIFIGEETDVAVATALYPILERACDKNPDLVNLKGRVDRSGFRLGFAMGITKKAKQERDASSLALVSLRKDEAIQDVMDDVGPAPEFSDKSAETGSLGYILGSWAGRRTSLSTSGLRSGND